MNDGIDIINIIIDTGKEQGGGFGGCSQACFCYIGKLGDTVEVKTVLHDALT